MARCSWFDHDDSLSICATKTARIPLTSCKGTARNRPTSSGKKGSKFSGICFADKVGNIQFNNSANAASFNDAEGSASVDMQSNCQKQQPKIEC